MAYCTYVRCSILCLRTTSGGQLNANGLQLNYGAGKLAFHIVYKELLYTHYNVISLRPHMEQELVETCVAVRGEEGPEVRGSRPTEHRCTDSIAHTHPMGGGEGGERVGVQLRSFGARG